MYQSQPRQLGIFLPFGGTLEQTNRWVRLAQLVPWAVMVGQRLTIKPQARSEVLCNFMVSFQLVFGRELS